jgi:hypothetical protein
MHASVSPALNRKSPQSIDGSKGQDGTAMHCSQQNRWPLQDQVSVWLRVFVAMPGKLLLRRAFVPLLKMFFLSTGMFPLPRLSMHVAHLRMLWLAVARGVGALPSGLTPHVRGVVRSSASWRASIGAVAKTGADTATTAMTRAPNFAADRMQLMTRSTANSRARVNCATHVRALARARGEGLALQTKQPSQRSWLPGCFKGSFCIYSTLLSWSLGSCLCVLGEYVSQSNISSSTAHRLRIYAMRLGSSGVRLVHNPHEIFARQGRLTVHIFLCI